MLFMPKKFDPEVKDRAVRMVLDRVEEAGSVTKAVALVSPKVDVGRETLRRWVSQHRVDAGLKDGPTSDDLAELRRLRSEVKRLREDNELLRKASIFFAGAACVARGAKDGPGVYCRDKYAYPGNVRDIL